MRDTGHCRIRCGLDARQARLSSGIRKKEFGSKAILATAPAFSTVARGAVGARPSETVARPSPHSPPVNPKMFGNGSDPLPRIPHANIQSCNCVATATSCGAAGIVPAACQWPQTRHRIEARNTTRAEPSPYRPAGKIVHLPYCPRHRPLCDG